MAQQDGKEKFITVIKRLVNAMNSSDYTLIMQEYSASLSTNFTLNKTTLFFKNLESQYGKVTKFSEPQLRTADQAITILYFEKGIQELTIYLDDQNKIKGFLFALHNPEENRDLAGKEISVLPESTKPEDKPIKESPIKQDPIPIKELEKAETKVQPEKEAPVMPITPKDKQQTILYPPFKGSWIIKTGTISQIDFTQSNLLQQENTYTFFAVDKTNARSKKDAKKNEDYFSYGSEILAPADGIIIEVIEGVRDNQPGILNPYVIIGNSITIQHSDKEYSVLAYLKQGSIRVKVGEKVTRGQVIAQCGNSGGISEPAIYYRLQDTPNLQTAKPIKFYFEQLSVIKDGKKELVKFYLPKNNEVISND